MNQHTVSRFHSCRGIPFAIQRGVTLVELMVSVTVGLALVLMATSLLLSARFGYLAQGDGVNIQESGRYALDAITRAVRQAGYQNWDRSEAPTADANVLSAFVEGMDGKTLRGTTPGIEWPLSRAVNGSDVLAIRFFGSGAGTNGDGVMMNCAGFSVPATSGDDAEDPRAWSIFYVGQDSSGEPELYCKFKGSGGWSSQAIVRGVESFQVLYGLDTDADGLPNQLMTATAINALDGALILEGANATERSLERIRKSYWKKVVTVKVALLIRGAEAVRDDGLNVDYALFGNEYAENNGASDPGTRISRSTLPPPVRNRIRKIFATTILLRNHGLGDSV